MTRRRKLILAIAMLVLVAGSFGAGTLATFNAQTNNAGNVFSHGTIVLSNTKQGGSACLSTGGGTTNTTVALVKRVVVLLGLAVTVAALPASATRLPILAT